MALKVYMDGKWVPQAKASISIFDHGVLYGDGVFEGIRAYSGLVFKLDEHIDRLWESAHTLMLKIPISKVEMKQAILKTLKINRLKDAYIRTVVTRGVGDLGLDPRKCPKPGIFIITDKIVLYPQKSYDEGLEIVTVATRRNLPEAINPRIKSLNYLNNILAKIEAHNGGAPEALMLDGNGFVVECSGDNIFIVKNEIIYTPPSYLGALEGITRDCVIEIAEHLGYRILKEPFTRFEIFNADECFLTGTAAEIVPVVKVDERLIGNGKPGHITKLLTEKFHKMTTSDGIMVYE